MAWNIPEGWVPLAEVYRPQHGRALLRTHDGLIEEYQDLLFTAMLKDAKASLPLPQRLWPSNELLESTGKQARNAIEWVLKTHHAGIFAHGESDILAMKEDHLSTQYENNVGAAYATIEDAMNERMQRHNIPYYFSAGVFLGSPNKLQE